MTHTEKTDSDIERNAKEAWDAMFGYFIGHTGPFRVLSAIIWGQDKATAQADCARRLREMGR